jgi:hypothetical protein
MIRQRYAVKPIEDSIIAEMKPDILEHIEDIIEVEVIGTFRGKRYIITFYDCEMSLLLKEMETSSIYRQKYAEATGKLAPRMYVETWRKFRAILWQKAYVRGDFECL